MKFMRRLAGNIGGQKAGVDSVLSAKDVKRVLISRPNGRLGNLLLITPLVQEISATFPNCKIDLFVKGGLAPVLFQNYSNVDRILQLPKKPFRQLPQYIWKWIALKRYHYDLVVNVVNYSSSGRLSTRFARSKSKFFGDAGEDVRLKYIHYSHIAKNPVYNLREYLGKIGVAPNKSHIAKLDLKLAPDEIANGKKLLGNIVGNEKKTIALFTYATGRKCYSPEWWESFYDRLEKEYPNYNIIEILPVENVSQLEFRIPSFYSKDVREIGSVIANAALFVGADSGIMHLASSVHTPTVGLFSVSNIATYRPYCNTSIGINTGISSTNELFTAIGDILSGKASLCEQFNESAYAALRQP